MTHLYVFGDSIAQGAWDPFGGWVQRVRTALDTRYLKNPDDYCLTFNMGVSGNTVFDVVKRFPVEMDARFNKDEDSVLLFAIGINDSQVDVDEGTLISSTRVFERNLTELLRLARPYTDKIGFVGLTPVVEDLVNPMPWARDRAYWHSAVFDFNVSLKNFCQNNDLYFVDIWDKWNNQDYSGWLFDGVHPNAEGHRLIAVEVIRQFVLPVGLNVPKEQEQAYIPLYG